MLETLSMTCLWGVAGLALWGQRALPARPTRGIGWSLVTMCALVATLSTLSQFRWSVATSTAVRPMALWTLGLMFIGTCLIVSKRSVSLSKWLAVGSAITLFGLSTVLLHASGHPLREPLILYRFDGYPRPHGIFYSPLEAGLVALVGWGLGWYWVSQSHSLVRWLGYGLVALSTACVYITLSRSAWLGLGVALVIALPFALRSRDRSRIIALALTVALFGICSWAMPIGWKRTAYAGQGDPSVLNRLTNWKDVPRTLWRYPFGVPTTPFVPMLDTERPAVIQTVNFYLDMGVNYGVGAMGLLLALSAGLAIRSVRLAGALGAFTGLGVAVVATLVCLGFMNPEHDPLTCTLLGGLWGLVAGVGGRGEDTWDCRRGGD